LVNKLKKALRITVDRLRTQGLRVTLLWVYARIFPRLTGIPILAYSQITPQIYIGAQHRKVGMRKLLRKGIDSDLNLRMEHDDAAFGVALPHYCYLPTVDDTPPSAEDLLKGIDFIRQRVASGGKVYIHCAGGVGRAPTMAAAYFISEGMAPAEAVALIEKHRPFVRMTPPQVAQLEQFARVIRQKR